MTGPAPCFPELTPEDFDEIEQTYNALGAAIGLPAQQLYERDT